MSNKSKDADPKQPDSSFIQFDDAKHQGAASAASAPRRKALLGVLTAACTILIVVSLGFVHPSTSGAWSIDWIIQTVTGESVVTKDTKASGSTTTSVEASSKDSKSSNDAKDESKDDSESSNKESDKSSDSKKSDGQDGKKSGDKSAAQNRGAGDTSNVSGGASSGGGQSSDGASSSNGGSAPSGGQGGSQESSYVTVTVSVTSSAVGNPVSSGGTTVYDALCALGLSVNAHGSSFGTYVSAIGGLAEKQYGGTSGWMYSVNGKTPNTACSNYILKNGDTVVWYYVTG